MLACAEFHPDLIHKLRGQDKDSWTRTPERYDGAWVDGDYGPPAYHDGWLKFKFEGGFPTITAEQRALQRRRLEGLGEEPTLEELGDMRWPQRDWWADRDRIGECLY